MVAGTFGGSDIGAMIGMKDFLGGDYRYVDFYTGLTGPAGDVTTTLSPLTDWPGPDSCIHVEPSGTGSLSVALSTGWNLISRPLDAVNPTVSAVYPTVIGGTTWAFTVDSGYVHRDTLEAGIGLLGQIPLRDQPVRRGPAARFGRGARSIPGGTSSAPSTTR